MIERRRTTRFFQLWYPVWQALAVAAVLLAWSLPDAAGCKEGRVPSAKPRARGRTHMDHEPKHGGVFFMASNGEHHLEGVYVRPDVLKIYLYDAHTQPIQAAFFKAEAELRGTDAAPKVPLTLDEDGALSAQFEVESFPFSVDVRIVCPTLPWSPPLDDVFTFEFERFSEPPVASTGAAPAASCHAEQGGRGTKAQH